MLLSRLQGTLVYYENQGSPQNPNFVLQTEDWQGIISSSPAWLADMDRDNDYDLLVTNPVTAKSGYTIILARLKSRKWFWLTPIFMTCPFWRSCLDLRIWIMTATLTYLTALRGWHILSPQYHR